MKQYEIFSNVQQGFEFEKVKINYCSGQKIVASLYIFNVKSKHSQSKPKGKKIPQVININSHDGRSLKTVSPETSHSQKKGSQPVR